MSVSGGSLPLFPRERRMFLAEGSSPLFQRERAVSFLERDTAGVKPLPKQLEGWLEVMAPQRGVRLETTLMECEASVSERSSLAAVIVGLNGLLAGLGLTWAALPMVIGGVGVAAMVVWIGWFWPDEA